MSDVEDYLSTANRFLERLPKTLRCLYASALLVLLAEWIIERGTPIVLNVFGISTTMGKLSYWLFLSLVLGGPVLYAIVLWLRIRCLRFRYPMRHFNKRLLFAALGRPLYLIDTRRKQIRWIANPITAVDLHIYPFAWSELEMMRKLSETPDAWKNKGIDLSTYTCKPAIWTRFRAEDFEKL